MADGPSPLVPFLMVVALGLVIYGRSLLNSATLVYDAEKTIFNFVLVIPLLVLLVVYFISKSVAVPLTLIFLAYMVSKMLLGPLVLVLIIYIVNVYLLPPSFQEFGVGRDVFDERDGSGHGWGWGWGSVLLLLIFLALYGLLHEGEGYELGLAVLAMVLFILYNLGQ